MKNRFAWLTVLLTVGVLGCESSSGLDELDYAAADSGDIAPEADSQEHRDAMFAKMLGERETPSQGTTIARPQIEPEPTAATPGDAETPPERRVIEPTPRDDRRQDPIGAEPTTTRPQPQPTFQPTTQTNNQPPVRLRAGVALPQTGPEGILMSFSVDYEFVTGGPATSSMYRWVIKGKGDKGGVMMVPLKSEGNLAILINGWRPEEGPYQSWLEEKPATGDPRRISDIEEMR